MVNEVKATLSLIGFSGACVLRLLEAAGFPWLQPATVFPHKPSVVGAMPLVALQQTAQWHPWTGSGTSDATPRVRQAIN